MWAAITLWGGRILSGIAALYRVVKPFLPFILRWVQGRMRQKNKQQAEELDAIRRAKDVRDHLASDPEYAERVRDRFTRR